MADTILESVKDAAAAMEQATETTEKAPVKTTKVEPKGETKEAPKEETSEESPDEVKLDERTERALKLLDMLEDPEKGIQVIQKMAKNAGLFEEGMTKKEEAKAESKFRDLARKTLGDEYEFLSDKIGDLLELVTENSSKELKALQEKLETESNERVIQDKLKTFEKINKVTEAESLDMMKLAQKFQPGPGVTLEEYTSELLEMVRSKAKATESKVKQVTKINENLKTKSTTGVEGSEVKPERSVKSVKDAVRFALEDMQE